jgi:hypothetical protein
MNGHAGGAPKLGLDTNTSPLENHQDSAISRITSPVTSPPYWVSSHQRSVSNISVESIAPGAITLQDNENGGDAKNKACWAKSVYIEDHTVVNERRRHTGAFVVWNITVETLRVGLKSERLFIYTYNYRVHPFELENDTPSSMTSVENYYKHSPIPKPRCHLYHQRA